MQSIERTSSTSKKPLVGFAAMSVVHLINRLLTKTLKLKSPIEVLEKLFLKVRLRNGLMP